MRDFDFDVMQKKQLNASARKRVCGSKSKRCGLPSDHLTPAQMKAKNGPVVSFDLNRPMDYLTFKAMPNDLKVEYLKKLNQMFGVGLFRISTDLFGKCKDTLPRFCMNHGIEVNLDRFYMSAKKEAVWKNWLNGEDVAAPDAREDAVEEIVPAECADTPQAETPREEPQCEAQGAPFVVSELSAAFTGEFDPIRFMNWMARLPMPDGNVRIRVDVTKV